MGFKAEKITSEKLFSFRASALAGLLVLGWLSLGCGKDPAEKEPLVKVQVTLSRRTTIQRVVVSEAVLFPFQQAALTPKISAPVREFFVQRGSRVSRGQLLAILENQDLSAVKTENQGAFAQAEAAYSSAVAQSIPEEIQKAELELEASKQELDTQKKIFESRQSLHQQGALPRKELDQAALALTQARAQFEIASKHLSALQAVGKQQQLKAAEGQLTAAKGKLEGASAQLRYSEIRSPIDGMVTERPFYPGEMANAGTPLMTVMDISRVIARAHIPQGEAAFLKVGALATLSASGVDKKISAKVMLVSPALDPNSTTVEVWIEAPNSGSRLRPGETVRVSIVAETIPDALVVPATALLTAPDGTISVMGVGNDGRAHRKNVEAGIHEESEVQIRQGLEPGEKIITTGAYGLPDKTRVQVEDTNLETKEKSGKNQER